MKRETINNKQFGSLLTKALNKVAAIDVKKQKTQEEKAIKKMQTKSPQPLGWFKDKKAFDTYIRCLDSIYISSKKKQFKQNCRTKFEKIMFGPFDVQEYYLSSEMILSIYSDTTYESDK